HLSQNNLPIIIKRIIKTGAAHPVFDLELENGLLVKLGGMDILSSFSKTRNVIAGATNIYIDDDVKKGWGKTVQKFLNVSIFHDIGAEEDETRTWVNSALDSVGVFNCQD